MLLNKKSRLIALGLTLMVLLTMAVSSVFAADVVVNWKNDGNGTNNGYCNSCLF
jgi:hypothetical protein